MNVMNVAPERAREACATCRQSHKKCTYDGNSSRCVRCERRNTQCSLFLSVDTTPVAQQGPPASVAYGSTHDAWAGTPHGSASSNFPHQSPLQEEYRWAVSIPTGNTQAEYPATMMIFQSSANPHGSEHPAMNQDLGPYGHHNVFGDHDGA